MATSERIFATPSSASHVQPLPRAGMLSFSGQLLGLRALLDLGTIFIGLAVSGFVVRAAAPAVQAHQETSRFAVALMGTALLAFANTYPRRRTPMDIAATEGLVRAVSLLAVLLAIAKTCFPTAVPRTAILSPGVSRDSPLDRTGSHDSFLWAAATSSSIEFGSFKCLLHVLFR